MIKSCSHAQLAIKGRIHFQKNYHDITSHLLWQMGEESAAIWSIQLLSAGSASS